MHIRVVHRYVRHDPDREYCVGIDPGTRNLGIAVLSRNLGIDRELVPHFIAHVDLGEDVGRDTSFVLVDQMMQAFAPVIEVLLACGALPEHLVYADEQQQKQRPDAFMVCVAGMLAATFYSLWNRLGPPSAFYPRLTHIQPTQAVSAKVQRFLLPTFDPLPMNGRTEKKRNTVSVVKLWLRMTNWPETVDEMEAQLTRQRKRKNGLIESLATGDVQDHPCDAVMMAAAELMMG